MPVQALIIWCQVAEQSFEYRLPESILQYQSVNNGIEATIELSVRLWPGSGVHQSTKVRVFDHFTDHSQAFSALSTIVVGGIRGAER